MLRQLSDQDALFLYLETAETPAHVGGVSLVELPAGYRGDFFASYRATIATRLALIPFMHAQLVELPLELDRPFWVEAESIDLDYHVRRATVPAPGALRDLEALVAELHAEPLDRSRPLWVFYVLDGLASGQPAIYTKIHHAAMDGAASQVLIATMYDPTPAPRVLPHAEIDRAGQRGSLANLARGVVRHRAQQVVRAMQYVPELARALVHLALPDPTTLRYRPIHRVPIAPHTPLNVGIGRDRAYAVRTLPLSAAKHIARHSDTTVNDVILTICSGVLREYLADRDALPRRSLTAMVPIAARDPADRTSANRNSLMLCSLASDVADPYERLLAVHRSALAQKQNFELYSELPVPDVPLPGVGTAMRMLIERYGRSRLAGHPPLLGNLVISNIPGPPVPLYIAGAKIGSMYPCSIPYHAQALNITVESYCDRLDFGLIACRRAVPDLTALADRLAGSLAALQAAVEREHPGATLRSAGAAPPVTREAAAGTAIQAEAPRPALGVSP